MLQSMHTFQIKPRHHHKTTQPNTRTKQQTQGRGGARQERKGYPENVSITCPVFALGGRERAGGGDSPAVSIDAFQSVDLRYTAAAAAAATIRRGQQGTPFHRTREIYDAMRYCTITTSSTTVAIIGETRHQTSLTTTSACSRNRSTHKTLKRALLQNKHITPLPLNAEQKRDAVTVNTPFIRPQPVGVTRPLRHQVRPRPLNKKTHCKAIRGGKRPLPSSRSGSVDPMGGKPAHPSRPLARFPIPPFVLTSCPRRYSTILPCAFTQCTDTGRESLVASSICAWKTSSCFSR